MYEKFGNYKEEDWKILKNGTRIHKTAIIYSPYIKFGDNCLVHPYAVIGRYPDRSIALARQPGNTITNVVKIGDRTVIGHHSVIFVNVVLGNDCLIGDHALVREGNRIGNECMIGCHVSISYDCLIGNRNRFQNGTVFHGECGDDCFFGVGVVCSSDKRIDLDNYQHLGSHPPIFGNRVLVGSGANILPEIEIGDDAIIGAGSVVVKSVEPQTLILGPIGKVTIPHVQV